MKRSIFIACVLLGCVDKVDLSLPVDTLPYVVEGMITTEPGPDTVRISKAYPANGTVSGYAGVPGAKVVVSDDNGLTDVLLDIGYGTYVTNLINGQVGRTYQLTVTFEDNLVAVSTPQRLVSAGEIDSIYYEFTSRYNTTTGLDENGFNIFINSTLDPQSSGRMKWRFLGTYTLTTDPSSIMIPYSCPPAICTMPLPCAANCECCTCWFNKTETGPILATPQISSGNRLNHVFMQYIPINETTFHSKYRVEISQTELSEEVFEFFKAIKGQEENSTSIFQPQFFEIKGNVTETSGGNRVLGTFSATTIVRKHIYIPRTAVPYALSANLQIGDCRSFAPFGSLRQPYFWE